MHGPAMTPLHRAPSHPLRFGPNSTFVQVLVMVLALVVIAVAIWGWRRFRPRLFSQIAVVLLAQVLIVVSVAIYVNRSEQIATTWSALTGSAQGLGPRMVAATDGTASFGVHYSNNWRVPPPDRALDTGTAYKSRIVQTQIPGALTGYNLAAQIYLPGSYDSPTSALRRYPVIELLAGFPGSYLSWTNGILLKDTLDQLIAEGKMPAVIAVMPSQNPHPPGDSECVDVDPHVHTDSRAETYLAHDLPTYVAHSYRAAAGRINWVVGGYSTGGYCAANLALRHPATYAAALVLSGYFVSVHDSTTGHLFKDRRSRRANSPEFTIGKPHPKLAIFTIAAKDNHRDVSNQEHFARRVPKADALMVMTTATGGHTPPVWRVGSRFGFIWLAKIFTAPGV